LDTFFGILESPYKSRTFEYAGGLDRGLDKSLFDQVFTLTLIEPFHCLFQTPIRPVEHPHPSPVFELKSQKVQ
jgi:hypothetical protein